MNFVSFVKTIVLSALFAISLAACGESEIPSDDEMLVVFLTMNFEKCLDRSRGNVALCEYEKEKMKPIYEEGFKNVLFEKKKIENSNQVQVCWRSKSDGKLIDGINLPSLFDLQQTCT